MQILVLLLNLLDNVEFHTLLLILFVEKLLLLLRGQSWLSTSHQLLLLKLVLVACVVV